MPGRKSLPDTLKRSPAKAQRTERWVPKGSRGPSEKEPARAIARKQ